jgi:hypothetical protein
MALASPGVLIKEIDFTATVQVADQNIGVVAVDAEKGPTDVVTYVGSERELVEVFGLPNDYNYESWFAASTLIQYGAVAAVIRPTGGNVDLGLNNANVRKTGTARTNLLIQNKDQFQTLEEGQKLFLFAARTAGTFNNGIKVAVVDHGADQIVTLSGAPDPSLSVGDYIATAAGVKGNVYRIDGANYYITLWDTAKRFRTGNVLLNSAGAGIEDDDENAISIASVVNDDVYSTLEYAPNRRWISLAPQPGTSQYALNRGARFDEFHIAIIDEGGLVSGTPNTILETLTYVSKAVDSRGSEGGATYYKKVIEELSSYVFAGDDDLVTKSTETIALEYIDASGTVQVGDGDLGESSVNQVFRLFRNANGAPQFSFVLSAGKNYDYTTPSDRLAVTDALAASYDLVKDSETFGDIDFLVPGTITQTSAIRLIDIAESRRDCMVCVSPLKEDVINSETSTAKTDAIISFFRSLPSSSFAIFDSGYKYIYDKYNDKYRYVPCAADVAGLCVSTTINSETWFSPAGYNRGNLRNAQKLAYSPRQTERDRLYINRINPVVSFPGQGIVLFGDKTALASPSAFDRINVRRLFIELEKNIASFSKYQLFELNDEITRSGFKAAVEPYLRGVQGRRGIYDFLVVCDSSNNTPDVIDRNEFNAEIYIKPARSINYITITFIATRTGVSFNELIN